MAIAELDVRSTQPPTRLNDNPPHDMEKRQNRDQQILIVEDDADIVRGMRVRLRSRGFRTIEAYDGHEGICAAREQLPDAIVLDVRMPRMDGLTALHELHATEHTRSIPVIMLSASLSDQQAAFDAGARFFIKKPYQNEVLLTAIETAIRENTGSSDDNSTCRRAAQS